MDDDRMFRAIVVATLALVVPRSAVGQTTGVLHVRVVLLDAEQKPTPVAGHVLLISANPSSAPPRRILTGVDGKIDVSLRPGNYTVESDQPVALDGKAYEWTQLVDVVAGRDTVLELTAGNADVGPVTAAAATASAPTTDPSFLLNRWQDSIVAIWTPTRRASAFVVDPKGLMATSQRAIGTATSVEVQLTSTLKVAGTVVAADPERDVAILWIDPATAAAIRPVPLGCERPQQAALVDGQEIFTIAFSRRREKEFASGVVRRVEPHRIAVDLRLEPGGAGSPVFTAEGALVGIASVADDPASRVDSRVARVEGACNLVMIAQQKIANAVPPSGAHLPVEPAAALPLDVLKSAAARRAGSLEPYQATSPTFDVAFFTPVMTYAARNPLEPSTGKSGPRGGNAEAAAVLVRPLTDFLNWSEYVAEDPPVLLVRVTPKAVEGFWMAVARGAAQTQGVSVPPLGRVKSAFSRMRAYCGETEITPIHPFRLERELPQHGAIIEGLYVFDPLAIGPQCGTVRLALYSDKEPAKPESVNVDPRILQRVWDDFAPYRALNP
jgi:S1-C subfamily serine protease